MMLKLFCEDIKLSGDFGEMTKLINFNDVDKRINCQNLKYPSKRPCKNIQKGIK